MKCDIYLKLWSHAQNCLICTLHPFYCEKKLSIRYGAHKPVRVSCSHCHVVDVMNDIILCSYTGFVLNVCLLNRCGKCTYMAINTFWIWIWNLNLNFECRCNLFTKASAGFIWLILVTERWPGADRKRFECVVLSGFKLLQWRHMNFRRVIRT